MLGPVKRAQAGAGRVAAAKLDVLTAAQAWYARGSQLAAAVPALETVVASADPDAAFPACITLEQALLDGWFDFDPPHSRVTPGGNSADLLAWLRQSAEGLSCGDVVIRTRLACAVADASLAASSTPAGTDTAFMPLMQGGRLAGT